VRQVGYLQRLYRDAARSTEHKILFTSQCYVRIYLSKAVIYFYTKNECDLLTTVIQGYVTVHLSGSYKNSEGT
jgi:hypothetical protein